MIKKLLSRIRDQGGATTGPDALRLVEMARAEHGEAERQLAAAQAAYRGSLLADDEKTAIAARAELTRREIQVDRAAAAIELAEAAHAEAEVRDAEAARRACYDEAQAKIAIAVEALGAYTGYARAIRAILVAVAEANVAMTAANADLPEGAVPLRAAEAQARGLPSEPEVILKRERKPDAWTYATPKGDDDVRASPFGYLGGPGSVKPELAPTGIEVTYIAAVPAYQPEPLATQIMLPDFGPGERFVWTPTGDATFVGPLGGDGRAVLERAAKLEAIERQPPEDPRLRMGKMTRVEPVPPGSPPCPPPNAQQPPARLVEPIMYRGPDHGRMS